jgi:hypothetical protein
MDKHNTSRGRKQAHAEAKTEGPSRQHTCRMKVLAEWAERQPIEQAKQAECNKWVVQAKAERRSVEREAVEAVREKAAAMREEARKAARTAKAAAKAKAKASASATAKELQREADEFADAERSQRRQAEREAEEAEACRSRAEERRRSTGCASGTVKTV